MLSFLKWPFILWAGHGLGMYQVLTEVGEFASQSHSCLPKGICQGRPPCPCLFQHLLTLIDDLLQCTVVISVAAVAAVTVAEVPVAILVVLEVIYFGVGCDILPIAIPV